MVEKINERIVFLGVFFILVLLISLGDVSGFVFDGYTKYVNGSVMGDVNVSLYIYNLSEGHSLSYIYSTISNSSTGYFMINVSHSYEYAFFSFKPVLIKYNSSDNYTAEYTGKSYPDFPYEEFMNVNNVTFYLRQAATLYFSGFGNEHWASQVSTSTNLSLPGSYYKGLEFVNNTHYNEFQWAYVNGSDCLIVLNYTRAVNFTQCDLNITNIGDLEFTAYGSSEYYLFVNSTQIEKCVVNYTGNVMSNLICNESADISPDNLVDVRGIERTNFGGPGYENIFVAGINSSGGNLLEKFYFVNLSQIEEEDISNTVPAGKMEYADYTGTDSYKLYFISNNSGVFSFYECTPQGPGLGPLVCYESTNFSNSITDIDGLAYDNYIEEWYYASSLTNNMTLFNFLTDVYSFNYQIKDTKLGYPLDENFEGSAVTEKTLYLPADRNYSLMIYPSGGPSFPVRININNIKSGTVVSACGSTITSSLFINCSGLNLTTNLVQLTGYATYNNSASVQNYTNFKIIAYLLEANNMVFKGATLPENMGMFGPDRISDVFNTTTGFYNMTLPGAALGSNLLLFASATVNNSGTLSHWGGFREVTLDYDSSGVVRNFTLYPLLGSESNISFGFSEGGNSVTTKQKYFRLINESGSLVTENAFVQASVDYSSVSGSNTSFSWMFDVSNGTFSIPLINQQGIDSMQIFSSRMAPLKKSISLSDINSDDIYNITLNSFSPHDPDNPNDASFINTIQMNMYKSGDNCSVPYPDSSCNLIPNPESGQAFNPLSVVLSGAKMDFEIRKTTNNITVRYIDVDLLASGPPDAMFDDSANSTSSSGSLEEAWRFGSQGPEIYKEILLGIPYNSSALNESRDIRVNITKFYSDASLTNVLWEQGVNTTTELNNTDYSEYSSSDWLQYVNGDGVLCNASDANLTAGLCYKDTAMDLLWFKIPHFSGISPKIIGYAISSSENNNNDNNGGSSGGGGGSSTSYFWISTHFILDNSILEEGYSINLAPRNRARFLFNNTYHYVGIVSLDNGSALVNVSSTPQQAEISIGQTKQFEINNDSYYDLNITLNEIINNQANITIKLIHEEIKESSATTESQQGQESSSNEENKSNQKDTSFSVQNNNANNLAQRNKKILLWVIVFSLIAIFIGSGVIYYFYYKKKKGISSKKEEK